MSNNHTSDCNGTHRDICKWMRTEAECCLNCGTLLIERTDVYKSLTFDDQFRLLKLYPGSRGSKLVCELLYARFESTKAPPPYEAISYTWSDENGVYELSKLLHFKDDDRPMRISKNCDSALRMFRHKFKPRTLWIDAVCIDQKNLLERSEQVKIMPKIYETADEVLVFLSELGDNDLPQFRQLFEYMNSTTNTAKFIPNRLNASWNALLSYRWFQRIWVLQEVLLAKHVVFFLGPLSISWELLRAYGREDVALFSLQNYRSLTMVKIFQRAAPCMATDPRDKVYALIGLLPRQLAKLIEPDYTKTPTEVFRDATLACIRQNQDPDILDLIFSQFTQNPSWAIDFSKTSNEIVRGFRPRKSKEKGDTIKEIQVLLYRGTTRLFLSGKYLDVILSTHDPREIRSPFFPYSAAFKLEALPIGDPENLLYDAKPTSQLDQVFSNMESSQKNISVPWGSIVHCPMIKEPNFADELVFYESSRDIEDISMDEIDLLAPYFEVQERKNRYNLIREKYSRICPIFASDLQSKLGDGSHAMLYIGNDTIGVCPFETQIGDRIYTIEGMNSSAILRRVGDDYEIVGLCGIATRNGCNDYCNITKTPTCTCVRCKQVSKKAADSTSHSLNLSIV